MRKTISFLVLWVMVIFLAIQPFVVVAQPVALPSLNSITPNSFASGINTPVTITGANLDTIVSARLGTTALTNLQISDAENISAQAPWNIQPGAYDLIVTDASNQSATLPAAVTVSTPATGWASNGPYGGNISDLTIDPHNPNRIYVGAERSGIFKTTDGAATWQMERVNSNPGTVHFTYAPGQTTPVMYLDGGPCCQYTLERSTDNGATWQSLIPPGYPYLGIGFRVAVDSAAPDRVYLALFAGQAGAHPEWGLYISNNRGDDWSRAAATNGLETTAVAVEPGNPNHVVVGTSDRKFLASTDGGATWSAPVTVGDADPSFKNIKKLVISPTLYEGSRKIWAISDGSEAVYYSDDDGATWNLLKIDNFHYNFDILYHDSIPGLIWAATDGGYYSSDDGATWNSLSVQIGEINIIKLVSGSLTRAGTTLYAGTTIGVFYSADGGSTWVEKDQGLGAALPGAIEVSPFNADEAYAAVQGKGLMRTLDGGTHWQLLTIPNGYYRPGMAADPFIQGKFYFSYGNFQSSPPVYITTDHGSSYTAHALALPPEYGSRQAEIMALAAHPTTSGNLLAGLCLDYTAFPNPTEGLIYASSDSGLTWTKQTTPPAAKCINSLVYAPTDPNLVYAGTEGGLLVSVDGGANWTVPANQPDLQRVGAVVVDPRNAQSVYLAGGPHFNGDGGGDVGIFATNDGGATWGKVVGQTIYPIWGLNIVPVGGQHWIYAATHNGLFFLRDISAEGIDRFATWERSSGIAGVATVDSFAAASDGTRVVYYIGTSGGAAPATLNTGQLSTAAATPLLAGGIYRRQGAESAIPQVQIPGWQLKNKSGFGNTNNRISALEVFNGQIYAATSNWGNGGARIWRSPDGAVWTPASEYGMSAAYGSSNPAILDLITYKGQLYASVGWGANEGQLWRSTNGTTWDKVSGSEWGGGSNQTIIVMAVFDNDLYAFSNGTAVEVWRSSTGDAGSWVREAQGGFGNANNQSAVGAAVFNNQLSVAVSNTVDGITIWSKPSGGAWAQINTSGFGDIQNNWSGGMAVLGEYLYVGVQNAVTGGQLWRYNGTAWSQTVGDGFGNLQNTAIQGLLTVQNQLFAVTNNMTTGLQVWHSANGAQWAPLNLNGLGKINNNYVMYSKSSTVYGNTFYVGIWNGVSGGEIWQYVGFPHYLPMIRK